MSEPSSGALAAGQVFHGRYQIVRCIKAGGMGAVYECIHLKTRKHRALKVMLPQIVAHAEMRDRFELEARATAEIESEHIVETFDAGVDDATSAPFLVMELLRGEDLATTLRKRGALSATETLLLLSQAALALDKTHAAGIVHRDLKPDNFYITTRDDGSPRLKILDFGIAKVVADVNQTAQQTAMIGTPMYMPPEQILGDGTIGPRADVYAMGHIAFTLLTGKAYWLDEQKATPALYTFLGKVMEGATEPPTARAARRGVTLPPAFDAWFARATAKAASDRFERVSALVNELSTVLQGSAPKAGVGAETERSAPRAVADAGLLIVGGAVQVQQPVGGLAAVNGTETVTVPARTEGQTTTVDASSTSIASPHKGSQLSVAMVALAALVLAALGLFAVLRTPKRGPTVNPTEGSVTATAAMVTAATPTATAAAIPQVVPTPTTDPAPPPIPPPSVTPAAAATAVPSAAAGPNAAATAAPPPVKVAPSATAKPPGPAKPPAPAAINACDPPYVLDGAGIRQMKPQCL